MKRSAPGQRTGLSFGKSTGQAPGPERTFQNRQTMPQTKDSRTRKHSSTARAKGSKTHQERGPLRTENAPSESGRKNLWPSFGTATDEGYRARWQAWATTKTVPKAQKRTKNKAVCGPKMVRLNPVCVSERKCSERGVALLQLAALALSCFALFGRLPAPVSLGK